MTPRVRERRDEIHVCHAWRRIYYRVKDSRRRTREGRRYGQEGRRRERARGEHRFMKLMKKK